MSLLRTYIRTLLTEALLERKQYVRFGEWPEDERSQVYVTDTPQKEGGVSVYPARWNNEQGKWEVKAASYGIGTHDPEYTLSNYADRMKSGDIPVFLVDGELVRNEMGNPQVGHDGEPLLRNVRKLKELSCEDIFVPQKVVDGRPEARFGAKGHEGEDCDYGY